MYKGAGFYDKIDGSLIELDEDCTRKVHTGEVWEGSKEDYNETFGIEEVTFTKNELINFLDQFINCEEEGILAKWNEVNKNSIEAYINEKFFD